MEIPDCPYGAEVQVDCGLLGENIVHTSEFYQTRQWAENLSEEKLDALIGMGMIQGPEDIAKLIANLNVDIQENQKVADSILSQNPDIALNCPNMHRCPFVIASLRKSIFGDNPDGSA